MNTPVKFNCEDAMCTKINAYQNKAGVPQCKIRIQPAYADGFDVQADPQRVSEYTKFEGKRVEVSGSIEFTENRFGINCHFHLDALKEKAGK